MKITYQKLGRSWQWSVSCDGTHIGGGHARTKAAAENDASIFIQSVLKSPRPPFPHDCTHETMPDGTIHKFRQPIRVF